MNLIECLLLNNKKFKSAEKLLERITWPGADESFTRALRHKHLFSVTSDSHH